MSQANKKINKRECSTFVLPKRSFWLFLDKNNIHFQVSYPLSELAQVREKLEQFGFYKMTCPKNERKYLT